MARKIWDVTVGRAELFAITPKDDYNQGRYGRTCSNDKLLSEEHQSFREDDNRLLGGGTRKIVA